MIDTVDRQLEEWVRSVLPDADLSFEPPTDTGDGRGVNLYLMELINSPLPGGRHTAPLQILLRYLVTSWAESSLEAHRMMGELVFAAMENSEFEVELETVPIDTWTAFGIAPRPSFILRYKLRVERPEKTVPLVSGPLSITSSPMMDLQGLVLGPGNVPIMGARVELTALQRFTYTDYKGRFTLPAIPGDQNLESLRVTARGWELTIQLEPTAHDAEPLVIHFNAEPEE